MATVEPSSVPAPSSAELIETSHAHRVELIISRLLRWGVFASLALLMAGTLISFFVSGRYGHTSEDLHRLTTASGEFPANDLGWLREGLRHGRGQPLIVLGMVLLITTPTLRVAVSIVAFVVDRDWAFVLITSIVLGLLVLSFLLGGVG